ncbi:Abi family protein [Savagea sp. SN6]|uniref:Abi family protein n=1 Tax=Savagea serpentis TaxID=2785297 RepID=A0A8J7GC90_9BACL|nr:Abi family protein [Savagea serpentis]MBF4502319.1 Abi family protein [Savagea serpentis]
MLSVCFPLFVGSTPNVKTYTKKSHTNNVSSDKFTKEDIKEIKNYHSDKPLPIWVVIEQLTFGEVTQILRFLNKNELRKIFKSIGEIDYSPIKVPAALNGVRYVRNLCSHNEKLINRTFKYSMPESTEPSLNNRVGLIKYLLFIKKIVKKYDPSNWRGFCEDLDSLIMNSKYISEKDLLFKSGYIEEYLK